MEVVGSSPASPTQPDPVAFGSRVFCLSPIQVARRANLAWCDDSVKSLDADSRLLSSTAWLRAALMQACGSITGRPSALMKFRHLVLAEWCVRNIQSRCRLHAVGRLKIDVRRFRECLRRAIVAT